METRRDRRPEALVLDRGVLREGPVCEFQSDLAVEAAGGTVVHPWRDAFRRSEAAELHVVADARELPDAHYAQVIVHVQRGRPATFDDLAQAWRILESGGQFLIAGSNSLGIVSAVKRLAEQLDQKGIVVANRARSRVVRFKKDGGSGPETEPAGNIEARVESIRGEITEFGLKTAPGVFSAKKLDAGSRILLESLARFMGHKPPKRVVDLGCGSGVLGIGAALLWPEANVLLADADARAVACASANIEQLGLRDRCRAVWWDSQEAPIDHRFQLALVNPPFHHRGSEVDLGPALALFDSLAGWLKPGARALLVANRTLPYEKPLAEIGPIEIISSARGYKLLSLKRSARSKGSRGRTSPSRRSRGSERPPIRSR